MRWQSDDGPIVVEVDVHDSGYQSVRPKPGEVVDVAGRFEDALASARSAAVSALQTFRHKALDADEIALEFGVKLTASAGAVIAKAATEAAITVKLKWSRSDAPTP
ncbi:MAG: hypothetical protein HOV87_11105 [Catenulispora sp.]|nr:hypothetical protein [Catenulispora sp.]